MGSTTYEWILDHEFSGKDVAEWKWPYDIPGWVFTHRQLPVVPDAAIEFVSGDVVPVHEKLVAAAGGRNVWIVGGGDLVGQFADAGLLDEVIVSIAPVTLGAGAPLLPRRIELQLEELGRNVDFACARYSVVRPARLTSREPAAGFPRSRPRAPPDAERSTIGHARHMIDLAQPAEPAVDVILRDGTTLRLRPPTEADVPGVMAFFADLSVRSRFLRFHGFTVAGDRFVRSFVEPDWAERGSLIGVMGDAAERARRRRRELRPPPRPAVGRGGVRRRRRVPGQGHRHPAARAAGAARRRSRHRGVHRRGAAREQHACSPCSRTPASCRRARSTAASSRCGSRSRRPRATARESTSATTSR